jgi:hypothetical protein
MTCSWAGPLPMAGFQVLIEYQRCSEHASGCSVECYCRRCERPGVLRNMQRDVFVQVRCHSLPSLEWRFRTFKHPIYARETSCSHFTAASSSSPVGRYWTYGTADPWKGTCWLKSSKNGQENQANRDSGWIPTPVAPGANGAAGALPPNPRDATETHTLATAVATALQWVRECSCCALQGRAARRAQPDRKALPVRRTQSKAM